MRRGSDPGLLRSFLVFCPVLGAEPTAVFVLDTLSFSGRRVGVCSGAGQFRFFVMIGASVVVPT